MNLSSFMLRAITVRILPWAFISDWCASVFGGSLLQFTQIVSSVLWLWGKLEAVVRRHHVLFAMYDSTMHKQSRHILDLHLNIATYGCSNHKISFHCSVIFHGRLNVIRDLFNALYIAWTYRRFNMEMTLFYFAVWPLGIILRMSYNDPIQKKNVIYTTGMFNLPFRIISSVVDMWIRLYSKTYNNDGKKRLLKFDKPQLSRWCHAVQKHKKPEAELTEFAFVNFFVSVIFERRSPQCKSYIKQTSFMSNGAFEIWLNGTPT